jgi:hypothetical protein
MKGRWFSCGVAERFSRSFMAASSGKKPYKRFAVSTNIPSGGGCRVYKFSNMQRRRCKKR